MPILFNAVAETAVLFDTSTFPSTQNLTITVPNVPYRIIVITFDCRPFGASGMSIPNITATYNGNGAAVSVGNITGAGPLAHAQMAYILNPDAVVNGTLAVTIPAGSQTRVRGKLSARVYYGVKQSGPFRAASTDAGTTGTSVSLTPASAIQDLVADTLCVNGVGNITSPGANQTQRYLSDIGSGGNNQQACHGGSDKAGGDGTTTMSWTVASGKEYAYVAAAMIPQPIFVPWIEEEIS